MKFKRAHRLRGTITVPGDKSISHRSIMFGALAKGTTRVTNFLQGADCLSTIACFERMGIEIDNRADEILIYGKGLHGKQRDDDSADQWYPVGTVIYNAAYR